MIPTHDHRENTLIVIGDSTGDTPSWVNLVKVSFFLSLSFYISFLVFYKVF
jgi:hypothetical protein